MKTLNTVVKILTALAAVAGAVYVIATYGDKIVAWAKGIWSKLPQCPECEEVAEEETVIEAEEAPAAEEAVEEPAAEEIAEEPAVEVVVDESEPVAEEADFAE